MRMTTADIAKVSLAVIAIAGGSDMAMGLEPREVGLDGAEMAVQRRAKKDRGEASMRLGDVDWQGTSAQARLNKTTLVIKGRRTDWPSRTSAVSQSIDLYLRDYKGPGRYEASIGSAFLVVGVDAGGATDSKMDAALVETLTKAKHLQIAGAEVVIESASDTEIVGTFSFDGGPTTISEGRFRALVKAAK